MTTRMLMGLLLFTMLCATAPPTTRVAHAADIPPFSPPWQRTQKINAGTDLCFDATMPGRFYTNAIPKGSGTYANNWQTGQNQVIQMRNYDACSEGSGYLFALNPDGATALRYNAGDTGGRTIAHYTRTCPRSMARSGTRLARDGMRVRRCTIPQRCNRRHRGICS